MQNENWTNEKRGNSEVNQSESSPEVEKRATRKNTRAQKAVDKLGGIPVMCIEPVYTQEDYKFLESKERENSIVHYDLEEERNSIGEQAPLFHLLDNDLRHTLNKKTTEQIETIEQRLEKTWKEQKIG